MTKYYKAIFPSGRLQVRSTASRTYTHAISNGSWSSRLDLALKEATRDGKLWGVAPAIEIDAKEYRTLSAQLLQEAKARQRAHTEPEAPFCPLENGKPVMDEDGPIVDLGPFDNTGAR